MSGFRGMVRHHKDGVVHGEECAEGFCPIPAARGRSARVEKPAPERSASPVRSVRHRSPERASPTLLGTTLVFDGTNYTTSRVAHPNASAERAAKSAAHIKSLRAKSQSRIEAKSNVSDVAVRSRKARGLSTAAVVSTILTGLGAFSAIGASFFRDVRGKSRATRSSRSVHIRPQAREVVKMQRRPVEKRIGASKHRTSKVENLSPALSSPLATEATQPHPQEPTIEGQ